MYLETFEHKILFVGLYNFFFTFIVVIKEMQNSKAVEFCRIQRLNIINDLLIELLISK